MHATDSDQRLLYSLAATFLGRMCLSGGIAELGADQWSLVRQAITLYQRAVPAIRDGKSTLHRSIGPSWRHPTGWQAVVRQTPTLAVVIVHAFAEAPPSITIPLPGNWQIIDGLPGPTPRLENGRLQLEIPADFSGAVHLLCPNTGH
jgi:alpha-galactosidase